MQSSELRFFSHGQLVVSETTVGHATFSASQLGQLPSIPLMANDGSQIAGACAAACNARFADVITEPLGLLSHVDDCRADATPIDTQFACAAGAEPTYFNGGPAAFRIEGSGSAEVSGGGAVLATLRRADLTVLPCSTGACPAVLSRVDVAQEGTANLGSTTLANLQIQNKGLGLGSWTGATNALSFGVSSLALRGQFDANGVRQSVEQTNSSPLDGTFAPDGSVFTFSRALSLGGLPAVLTLGGAATGHPPSADFSPKGNVECNQVGGAALRLVSSASDPDGDIRLQAWWVDGSYRATASSLDTTLALGTHAVGLDVFDSRGAASERRSPLAVVDRTPPMLSASAEPSCLWPPNHDLVLFQLGDGLTVSATDICDPNPKIDVVGVATDQGSVAPGSGQTSIDVLVGSHGFCVRSERAGNVSSPRQYTATIRATDASGNSTTADVVVVVSHDRADLRCADTPSARIVPDSDPRCTY